MFTVEVENKEYRVNFKHYNPELHDTKFYMPFYGTLCNITTDDGLWVGTTHLHHLDYQAYNKRFGRKLSLQRALKDTGFNKEIRTLFWQKYHKISPYTKPEKEEEKENDK